ncbi:hypothetical protein AC244_19975 [Ensifer adhaerens]|uniref:Uncharacterized protein n=1 Tax=Ensifer adhaerens TaxID=106592 RepID=A0A0L8BQI3_ENSAD|nr:hypothetical protein AC244_19975 [Ensifer adhaerens]
MLRPAMVCEIGWRAEDNTANNSQSLSHQAGVGEVSNPHHHVEPAVCEIDKCIGKVEFNLDLPMLPHVFGNDRHQEARGKQRRRTDPQHA